MRSFAFPGNIEPEILAIAGDQVPYMRTPWFSDLVLACESMLLELLDCPGGRVIPYTASGTAAMDACVGSFVAPRRRALVVNGGTFGARWCEICRFYGVCFDEFTVPFGRNPDMARLNGLLDSGAYDVLLMQHHETSSGCLYDLESISGICRARGVRLVVDAISSFLADHFSMASWGVDVAVLSSQKGLNLPPGLSFVVLSKPVLDEGRFGRTAFSLDWPSHLVQLARGQTPFSPATHLFMQLHARLTTVQTIGTRRLIGRVSDRAEAFRRLCRAHGWTFSADTMSNSLTGVCLPFPVRPLIHDLLLQQTYVMPSGPENMIRVTHTGTLDSAAHEQLVEEIVKWQSREKP